MRARRRRADRAQRDLDVQAQQHLRLRDEVGDRQERLAAQRPQHVRELGHPRAAGLAQPPAVRAGPAGRRQPVERVDDRALVDHVGRRPLRRRGRPPTGVPGPVGQRRQVRQAQPGPRTGEQPHQGVAPRGVVRGLQGRDQVHDLRRAQQPAQAHHLDREPQRVQRRLDRGELRALAAQHRGRRGRPSGRPGAVLGHEPRDGRGLVHLVGLDRGAHQSGAGQRPRREPLDRVRRGRLERARDEVGGVQHGQVVAPRRGQVPHHRFAACGGAELGGEPEQPAGAGPAPPVDRLVRVADRGHRVPGPGQRRSAVRTAAEQVAQQVELGHGGVLVLVQQHHREPGALARPDLGHLARDAGGQGHLVGEVHEVAGPLARGELVEHRGHRGPQPHRPGHLRQRVRVGLAATGRRGREPVGDPGRTRRRARPGCAGARRARRDSSSRARVIVDSARSVPRSSAQCSTTSWASCQRPASPISREAGSTPSRRAWSPTSEAAYAWYVDTVGARNTDDAPAASLRRSAASRARTRSDSSPAALRVKVRPSTASGATSSLATSHTTRAAIVSVLPDPAPATTSIGSSGASITASCSGVGRGRPSASAIAAADHLMRPPPGPRAGPGRTGAPGSCGTARCARRTSRRSSRRPRPRRPARPPSPAPRPAPGRSGPAWSPSPSACRRTPGRPRPTGRPAPPPRTRRRPRPPGRGRAGRAARRRRPRPRSCRS